MALLLVLSQISFDGTVWKPCVNIDSEPDVYLANKYDIIM